MATNVAIPGPDDKPNTFGWIQMEKSAAAELQTLAMKSPVAMATLMYLISHMTRTNSVLVSQQGIADAIGATRRSVNTAIATLESMQFVGVTKAAGAMVYSVNTKVAWQGHRGERFAHFTADIVAFEKEQGRDIDQDKDIPLKSVPVVNPEGI